MQPQNITRHSPSRVKQLVDEARAMSHTMPPWPGIEWTDAERNLSAAYVLANKLNDQQISRSMFSTRLHNLIGDLEELYEQDVVGTISDHDYRAGISDVLDNLWRLRSDMKGVSLESQVAR